MNLSLLKETQILLKKELLLELRKKQVLIGLAVYLFSTVFLIYTLEDSLDRQAWNTLFWMTIIFVTINASAKSFLGESHYRQVFYYSRFSPLSVILSKQIYSVVLSLLFATITYAIFYFFYPISVARPNSYFFVLLLGTVSVSLCMTFLSSLSSQVSNGSSALTAIMGLPLLIPLFIFIKQISLVAIKPVVAEGLSGMFGILVGYDCVIFILSLLLFPFVWQE